MAIDIEAIKRKVEELQGNRKNSRVQLWKPEIGTYRIRALPWKDCEPGQPFKELWFYYLGDAAKGMLAPHQFGKPDPIQDLIIKLYSTGSADDRLTARKLRPKMRAYVPILVREENGKKVESSEILVWSFGRMVYQRLLGFFLKADIDDYLDPKTGFDLEVTLSKIEGKRFFDTAVDVARRPSAIASTDEEIKSILDSIPDIMDMWPLKTPQEISAVLQAWLADEPLEGEGTTRNVSEDALDALADDVMDAGNTSVETKQESEKVAVKDAKPKKIKKEAAKTDDDDVMQANLTLNEVFDELMSDD